MTQQAEIMNKIDKIPQKYIGEVIDFLGYLQHKAEQEANNTKPEQNSCESIPQIPTDSNGKFLLTRDVIEEMIKNSPRTQALSGIPSGMGDIDLDENRYKGSFSNSQLDGKEPVV